MNEDHVAKIADELSVKPGQVAAVARLLSEDATVPFIARYRKEATGSLDEVAVTEIRDRLSKLAALSERRESILKSLEKNGHLTDELKGSVMAAETLSALEDIYLPYRPKRRTRATIAREKGLEPLAELIFVQDPRLDPEREAAAFVDPEKGVETALDALSGARDIIAEKVSEDAAARAAMREFFAGRSVFRTTLIEGKEAEGAKFKDYFAWEEKSSAAPSHRVLAMRRGENEGVLDLAVSVPEDEALSILEGLFVKNAGPAAAEVKLAVTEGFRRLLSRSMETEVRMAAKTRADVEAVRVFAENLRNLLLSPPLGQKRVCGIDPGLRTGCKVVFLSAQGALLHHDVIFPHGSDAAARAAAEKLSALCEKFAPEAVAVGNGTAGRETEAFVRGLHLAGKPPIIMVDESGASVYSASDVAREEFPDQDVTVRGAVSIGRRLMDPLAELVKIDPKSIGVGQYQHDVDQGLLKDGLDDVVISCVNAVGVDVNTASARLLQYVSGLGPALSVNIVSFRTENGAFKTREDLRKVPRLGPKAFEQAAGFLRIRGGENPLDASAVHPESYPVVDAMARDLSVSVGDLVTDPGLRARIDVKRYVSDSLGLPTLNDIMAELAKPGRDPRETLAPFSFAPGITDIGDLSPGMVLPGVVTNVTAFGAFVDVGVHVDGLVHVSQLSDRFVKDPSQVVKVQQRVEARVVSVDLERKRIALSLKKEEGRPRDREEARAVESPAGNRPGKSGGFKKRGPGGPQRPAPEKTPFNNPFGQLAELSKKSERKR